MLNIRNEDPASIEGFLLQRGRRTLRMNILHFKLFDNVLECRDGPCSAPTWSVSVLDAKISRVHKRGIVITLNGDKSKIRLRGRSNEEACAWEFHLRRASQRRLTDRYELQDRIGEGNFAEVLKGIETSTRKTVAVKVMEKEPDEIDQTRAIDSEIEFVREDVQHPNVIRTLDVFNTIDKLFIVMEHGGRSLQAIMHEQGTLSERDTAHIVGQLLDALEHLHSRGIVHRDIKPDNVLVSAHKSPFDAKLTDFGLCGMMSPTTSNKQSLEGTIGTPAFIAPEVLTESSYGQAVDLWSLGVLTYEMLSGGMPFTGHTMSAILDKVEIGSFGFYGAVWNGVSEDAKDFVRGLLRVKVEERFSVQEAKKHRWIQGGQSRDGMANVSSLNVEVCEASSVSDGPLVWPCSNDASEVHSIRGSSTSFVDMQEEHSPSWRVAVGKGLLNADMFGSIRHSESFGSIDMSPLEDREALRETGRERRPTWRVAEGQKPTMEKRSSSLRRTINLGSRLIESPQRGASLDETGTKPQEGFRSVIGKLPKMAKRAISFRPHLRPREMEMDHSHDSTSFGDARTSRWMACRKLLGQLPSVTKLRSLLPTQIHAQSSRHHASLGDTETPRARYGRLETGETSVIRRHVVSFSSLDSQRDSQPEAFQIEAGRDMAPADKYDEIPPLGSPSEAHDKSSETESKKDIAGTDNWEKMPPPDNLRDSQPEWFKSEAGKEIATADKRDDIPRGESTHDAHPKSFKSEAGKDIPPAAKCDDFPRGDSPREAHGKSVKSEAGGDVASGDTRRGSNVGTDVVPIGGCTRLAVAGFKDNELANNSVHTSLE